MWTARTKNDLIVEVWEKLDCENVGASELEAIEMVVRETFGENAVDPPMRVARLLADEGAELRHPEIMGLHIARLSHRPYEPAFRSILDIKDLRSALTSIHNLENLRRKYNLTNDRDGLRLVRDTGIAAKDLAQETAVRKNVDPITRQINEEVAQWFIIWLQTPDVFENWVSLRQSSRDFIDRFGHVKEK